MTNERARTELEQLYMSLSEEKKKALDVAFKAMAQADGEKTCGTCRNEDTYHCADCENKSDYEQAQADGDLISRAELLKALETWDRFGVDDTNSLFRLDNLSLPHYVAYIHYDDVVKCIKGMPSVDIPSAEPKTGHWIEHPEIETSTPEYLMFYECSECGDKQCFCKSDIHKKHFCNNCGAKMN